MRDDLVALRLVAVDRAHHEAGALGIPVADASGDELAVAYGMPELDVAPGRVRELSRGTGERCQAEDRDGGCQQAGGLHRHAP
jgi:hypothetical protein